MTLYDTCAAGQCVDYRCAMYGCMRRNTHMAIIQPVTQGCICPPTSEQTCQNDRCPRAPLGVMQCEVSSGPAPENKLERRWLLALDEIERLKAEVSSLNHAEVKLLVQVDEQAVEIKRLRAALRAVDDEHGYGLPPETRKMIHTALKEDGDA